MESDSVLYGALPAGEGVTMKCETCPKAWCCILACVPVAELLAEVDRVLAEEGK